MQSHFPSPVSFVNIDKKGEPSLICSCRSQRRPGAR